MSLAENLHFHKSASIAFAQTNAVWAEPKPLYKQKEQTRKTKNLVCLLFFSVSDVFANAKVMLCYA